MIRWHRWFCQNLKSFCDQFPPLWYQEKNPQKNRKKWLFLKISRVRRILSKNTLFLKISRVDVIVLVEKIRNPVLGPIVFYKKSKKMVILWSFSSRKRIWKKSIFENQIMIFALNYEKNLDFVRFFSKKNRFFEIFFEKNRFFSQKMRMLEGMAWFVWPKKNFFLQKKFFSLFSVRKKSFLQKSNHSFFSFPKLFCARTYSIFQFCHWRRKNFFAEKKNFFWKEFFKSQKQQNFFHEGKTKTRGRSKCFDLQKKKTKQKINFWRKSKNFVFTKVPGRLRAEKNPHYSTCRKKAELNLNFCKELNTDELKRNWKWKFGPTSPNRENEISGNKPEKKTNISFAKSIATKRFQKKLKSS